ncbi:MAG: sarcosine oxidase subunit delta [Gammaproteobacteria bacterium]|nr:sarcosine oxidase subunit delta [Gammaproteobacteria bacterium]MDA8023554.1 sarcosine oxidase subunit delta [Gammaproteobacteria bacterium]
MMRINCPFCGLRDHAEFAYGGDGSVRYPPLDAPAADWHDAVFLRANPRGMQTETWQHLHGCRMWLLVERDTATHEIRSVRAAHDGIGAALRGEQDGAR